MTELTDEQLVQLCQARGSRDERPFQELFYRHKQMVWRVCYRFISNRDDAEDLTQQVFFKVYRSLHQFEGRSSFKTWIYRIAINTSQNELRRRSRRLQESEAELDTVAEFIPGYDSPEQDWLAKVESAILAEAFRQLRPAEQEVLFLKDLEDRQYADIAEILEISLSAAKMRVQRARSALRQAYLKLSQPQTKEVA